MQAKQGDSSSDIPVVILADVGTVAMNNFETMVGKSNTFSTLSQEDQDQVIAHKFPSLENMNKADKDNEMLRSNLDEHVDKLGGV